MSNMLIGYPNRSDAGTLSGGGWEADLPLTNLQKRLLSRVARSTSADLSVTGFVNDLGSIRAARLLSLHNHNLSLAAKYHVQGWSGTFTRDGIAGWYDENGIYRRAPAKVPRLGHHEPYPILTATRTTVASEQGEDDVWVEQGINYLRRDHYVTANDGEDYRTIIGEMARTNVLLEPRDLTNAAWTASNITPTLDQVGIYGVANSATRLTATAGNGTILQAVTLTSSERKASAFVQRITGTGDVEMTTDGGSTWTAVTVTDAWTRVGIDPQTLANPSTGFRLVTSGDEIAVDVVQNEAGAFATTPVFGASATTRAADGIQAPIRADLPDTGMVVAFEFVDLGTIETNDARYWAITATAAANPRLLLRHPNSGIVRADLFNASAAASSPSTGSNYHVVGDHVAGEVEVEIGTGAQAGNIRAVLRISVNGGTETVSNGAWIAKDFTNWSDALIHINGRGTSNVGATGLISLTATETGGDTFFELTPANANAKLINRVEGKLLEGASTNLVTDSEDLSAWATVTTVPTFGTADADSGVSLDLVEDTNAGSASAVGRVCAFTADAVKAVSVHVKRDTSTSSVVRLRDTSASANRLLAAITWDGNDRPVVTMTTGTLQRVKVLTDGAWRVEMQTASVTAANTNRLEVFPAADASFTATLLGAVYIGGAQAENSPFSTSYIRTGASAVSRVVDFMQETVDFAPQALTAYSEWIEQGTAFMATAGSPWYWQVGSATVTGTTPRMYLYSATGLNGRVNAVFDDGTNRESIVATGTVARGDKVQARVRIFFDGDDWNIRLHVSVNGGAEVDGGLTTMATTLPAAWAAQALTINSRPDGSNAGFGTHVTHKFAAGDKSMAEMKALVAADALYVWEPYASGVEDAYPVAYPAGSTLYGEDVGGQKVTEEQRALLWPRNIYHILDENTLHRRWSIELFDVDNTDGYVQAGRLVIAPTYQPSRNFGFGAEIGWQSSTNWTETDGGATYVVDRPRRRRFSAGINKLPRNEALVDLFSIFEEAARVEQVVFIFDPDDEVHLARRSFLALMDEENPLTIPYFHLYDALVAFVEELP